MAPHVCNYIIDRSTRITCPKCGNTENPAVFIDGIWLQINGVVKCQKCGAIIVYELSTIYTVKEPLTLLQEIKEVEDIQ